MRLFLHRTFVFFKYIHPKKKLLLSKCKANIICHECVDVYIEFGHCSVSLDPLWNPQSLQQFPTSLLWTAPHKSSLYCLWRRRHTSESTLVNFLSDAHTGDAVMGKSLLWNRSGIKWIFFWQVHYPRHTNLKRILASITNSENRNKRNLANKWAGLSLANIFWAHSVFQWDIIFYGYIKI